MTYKYIVVWFTKATSWISGDARPIYPECKVFHSLERAKEFSKGWTPPVKIYVLMEDLK